MASAGGTGPSGITVTLATTFQGPLLGATFGQVITAVQTLNLGLIPPLLPIEEEALAKEQQEEEKLEEEIPEEAYQGLDPMIDIQDKAEEMEIEENITIEEVEAGRETNQGHVAKEKQPQDTGEESRE